MTYNIEWQEYGAVKRYTGDVSFAEVLSSESRIAAYPNFTSLRYVILDYLNAKRPDLNRSELTEIRAQRVGGFFTNPRIKYAFATTDAKLKAQVEQGIADGQFRHVTKVFPTYEDAFAWATSLNGAISGQISTHSPSLATESPRVP